MTVLMLYIVFVCIQVSVLTELQQHGSHIIKCYKCIGRFEIVHREFFHGGLLA